MTCHDIRSPALSCPNHFSRYRLWKTSTSFSYHDRRNRRKNAPHGTSSWSPTAPFRMHVCHFPDGKQHCRKLLYRYKRQSPNAADPLTLKPAQRAYKTWSWKPYKSPYRPGSHPDPAYRHETMDFVFSF